MSILLMCQGDLTEMSWIIFEKERKKMLMRKMILVFQNNFIWQFNIYSSYVKQKRKPSFNNVFKIFVVWWHRPVLKPW